MVSDPMHQLVSLWRVRDRRLGPPDSPARPRSSTRTHSPRDIRDAKSLPGPGRSEVHLVADSRLLSCVGATSRGHAHLTRLWQRGAQELIRLDPDALNQLTGTGNLPRDALTVLTAAAWLVHRGLGINGPLWTLIGLHTHGKLLASPG